MGLPKLEAFWLAHQTIGLMNVTRILRVLVANQKSETSGDEVAEQTLD